MLETKAVLYLFIKNEIWSCFIFAVEEDSPFKAKLWDEYDDGVLPHKQDVPIFIQDTSALKEQLQRHTSVLSNCEQCTVSTKQLNKMLWSVALQAHAFTCVWNATDAL